VLALREAEALGAAGRRRALDRFTLDVVADAWSDLLADVVAGRSDQAGPADGSSPTVGDR